MYFVCMKHISLRVGVLVCNDLHTFVSGYVESVASTELHILCHEKIRPRY